MGRSKRLVDYFAHTDGGTGVGGSILSIVTGEGAAINSHFLGWVTGGGRRFPVGEELGIFPPRATRGVIGARRPLADAAFI